LWQEYHQIGREKWAYIFSPLNLLQLFTTFLNLYIIGAGFFLRHELAKSENEFILVTGPSIGAFFMVIQLFDWMGLFEKTSFFVTMLV
jgi:hypothetical protein